MAKIVQGRDKLLGPTEVRSQKSKVGRVQSIFNYVFRVKQFSKKKKLLWLLAHRFPWDQRDFFEESFLEISIAISLGEKLIARLVKLSLALGFLWAGSSMGRFLIPLRESLFPKLCISSSQEKICRYRVLFRVDPETNKPMTERPSVN